MRYRPAAATHYAQMRDDTGVVLDLGRRHYLHLNPSGALLWSRLQGGASVDELAAALVERFAIEPLRATADAQVWIDDMVGRGAVVRDD